MSYMTSQITQDVSFVLLSHVLEEIHMPTTDAPDDVTNHTGRQFCALVQCLKRISFPNLIGPMQHSKSCRTFCGLVRSLKQDPSPQN